MFRQAPAWPILATGEDDRRGPDVTLQADRTGRGFTLIEILIVVTLLGVLAAIAVPAMNTYGKTARQSTLVSTVHTLRGQIQAYRIQHGDELPDLAAASAGGNHFQPL